MVSLFWVLTSGRERGIIVLELATANRTEQGEDTMKSAVEIMSSKKEYKEEIAKVLSEEECRKLWSSV